MTNQTVLMIPPELAAKLRAELNPTPTVADLRQLAAAEAKRATRRTRNINTASK